MNARLRLSWQLFASQMLLPLLPGGLVLASCAADHSHATDAASDQGEMMSEAGIPHEMSSDGGRRDDDLGESELDQFTDALPHDATSTDVEPPDSDLGGSHDLNGVDASPPYPAPPEMWCLVESPSEGEVVNGSPISVRVLGLADEQPVQVCRARVTWRGADPRDIREERQMCGYDSDGAEGVVVVHFHGPEPGPVSIEVEMLITLDPPYHPGGYLRSCERSFTVE